MNIYDLAEILIILKRQSEIEKDITNIEISDLTVAREARSCKEDLRIYILNKLLNSKENNFLTLDMKSAIKKISLKSNEEIPENILDELLAFQNKDNPNHEKYEELMKNIKSVNSIN